MWLYFNSNGQLTTTLEHGSPARVGSTDFSIFAVFEGLDENNISDYMATILLRKPDLTGSTYPTLLMQIASAEFIQGTGELNTGDFVSGRTYYGFLFDFGDFDYDPNDDDEIVLLDTDGLWQATINLIRENYNVQGVATFNVGGTGTETETEVSYTIITNQLVHEINKRALKTQTIISRSYEAIVTNLGDYENGQIFYATDTHRMYQKVSGELEEIGTYNVDSSLSLTSENPVQNKVVKHALDEIIGGVYKPQGSISVSDLNGLTKDSSMNGNVYNMLDAGSLTNEDGTTISVQIGDNVAFLWNDGNWHFDSMVGFVDTSDLVTLSTNQTITGFKTFASLRTKQIDSGEEDLVYASSGVSIRPNMNNSVDLGSTSYTWRDLYLSGKSYFIDTSYADTNNWQLYATNQFNLIVSKNGTNRFLFQSNQFSPADYQNPQCNLGSANYSWKDLYLVGTIDFGNNAKINKDSSNRVNILYNNNIKVKVGNTETYFANHVEPDSANSYDLGRNGLRWRCTYTDNISDGTNSATVASLISGRAAIYKHNIVIFANNGDDEFHFSFVSSSSGAITTFAELYAASGKIQYNAAIFFDSSDMNYHRAVIKEITSIAVEYIVDDTGGIQILTSSVVSAITDTPVAI